MRPDPALSRTVADATREAVTALRVEHPESFYAFALLTSGEGHAPYLSACSVEADAQEGLDRWNLAETPYVLWGYEEHFADVVRAFAARPAPTEAEHAVRLASIEEGLRLLDVEGFFGPARQDMLLIAGTMPPDHTDAGFVRRLNPAGALYEEWLRDCAEQPRLTHARPTHEADAPSGDAPNHAMAELWRSCAGFVAPDGTAVYGPADLEERNETFEVARYAPGWVLVGDDSGGRGLLMRATGPGFSPTTGRDAAEVFALDLGALCDDVPAEGEFVTDDLIGWLTTRSGA